MANERYLYEDTARDVAGQYGVPPAIFASLISTESGWNPSAHAQGSTASGLTQMIDGTAAAMGADKGNPRSQMEGGAKYLRQQYDRTGNWNTALAAYNQGPGAANNPAGQKYASKVMAGAPSSDPHVDALLSLPDVKGGDSAPAPAHADPAVASLLAMPDVEPADANMDKYDRGVVPPVKDVANEEDQRHDARPSWLKASMRAVPGSKYTDEFFTPRGRQSIARGGVKTTLGLPGSVESALGGDQAEAHRNWLGDLVFGKDSPPTDPKLLGHGTSLPNSNDADNFLTSVGWKPDANHKEGEDVAERAALAATGVLGVESLARSGAAKLRNVVRGGTPEQLALRGDVEKTAAARSIPGEKPMSPELAKQPPDVTPKYPGPIGTPGPREVPGVGPAPTPAGERRKLALKDAPGVTRGQPASAHAIDDEMEAVAGKVQSEVSAEKMDVRSTMEWSRTKDRPMPDLQPLSDHIDNLIENTAGASKRAAMQARNQLEEITGIEDPVARHEQLDQFKRDLANKGGVEAEGYKAIGVKQAAALKVQVDEALKEYAPFAKYAEDYAAASGKSKPFRASFMQQLGADESSSTMMDGAMKSPRNVDIGVKAVGGLDKFDPIAAKHVVAKVADMDSAQLEKWAGKNKEILDKLPQARAAFEGVQSRVNMHSAMEGATKRYEEALVQQANARTAEQERAKAFTQMHVDRQGADMAAARQEADQTNKLQRSATDEGNRQRTAAYDENMTTHQNAVLRANRYAGDLRELQAALPKDRAASVERIVRRMNDDGLISSSEHAEFLRRIADAKIASNSRGALSTLSKYVAYALTGNYLVSFGGPALIRAVATK